MSSLENLTKKILDDSESKARELLDQAQLEAKRINDEAAGEAENQKQKILSEAKVEAAREEEQIVVGMTLQVRDRNLDAKQQMLDKVFTEALRRLNDMNKEDFLKFLTDSLSGLDLDGETVVAPKKYGLTDLNPVNDALKKAGKKGNLTLDGQRDVDGGFLLCKGGIEQNNTFDALISYYRYELESEVLKRLY